MRTTADLSWIEVGLRLLAAVAFASLVGFEREADGQDAGIRTHALLALGAAIFGVISVGAFDDFIAGRNDTNVTFDVSRIASYVAAGIGFLGGGAIVKRKDEDRIYGLTTAASLWTVAAVGLSAGLGFWPAAALGTVAALIVLVLGRPLKALANRRQAHRR